MDQHDTDYINLLFNNAGVGGGGGFVAGDRASWERTFNICWGGVYNGCRAFVPLLVASDDGLPRQHVERERLLRVDRSGRRRTPRTARPSSR